MPRLSIGFRIVSRNMKHGDDMKIATIDIGTNTFLLLVSEFDALGNINILRHEQRIPRIGKDVDKEGNIGIEAFKKSEKILNEYKSISNSYSVDKIVATGTSALRDAKNKNEFIEYIKNYSGVDIEIIAGVEEALWSYRGATSNFLINDGSCAVIDIGGGSTEIVLGEGKNILKRKSLNIGCVRLTERFLLNDPPLESEIDAFKSYSNSVLREIEGFDFSNSNLVGVAGTITTLAAYHQNLECIDIKKISGYKMKYEDILHIFDIFKKKSTKEIGEIPCIPVGRADVILAGILILLEFMKYFGIKEIYSSERGLRYGIAIREWEKSNI
jgi:exopolyphosphatase / guanosine-5'-triphosphate,3'-diphosphate pyrophosphatase